jgi:hypothetical protein
MSQTDELLFQQSYLNGLARPVGLAADEFNMPANFPVAMVSAAYGYTRGGLHSPLYAALFGYFGWEWPLLSAAIVAFDAVLLNKNPAADYFHSRALPSLKKKLGFSGISSSGRRCRKGYRRRGNRCVRR